MRQKTLFPVPIRKKKAREFKNPAWAEGMEVFRRSLNVSLPTTAIQQGYQLHLVEFWHRDPVFLYDRNGNILHEWKHIPSLTEVFEVCSQRLGN